MRGSPEASVEEEELQPASASVPKRTEVTTLFMEWSLSAVEECASRCWKNDPTPEDANCSDESEGAISYPVQGPCASGQNASLLPFRSVPFPSFSFSSSGHVPLPCSVT